MLLTDMGAIPNSTYCVFPVVVGDGMATGGLSDRSMCARSSMFCTPPATAACSSSAVATAVTSSVNTSFDMIPCSHCVSGAVTGLHGSVPEKEKLQFQPALAPALHVLHDCSCCRQR